MSTAALIFPAHASDRLLYGCVVASILAHALVMWHTPQVEPKAPPTRLTAVLREAAPPAPPPQAAATQPAQAAEPSKPDPPRPQSRPEPRPEARAESRAAPAPPDPRSVRPKVEPAPEAKAAPADPAPAAPLSPAAVAPSAVAPAPPPADIRGEVKGEKEPPRTASAAPSSPATDISDKALVDAYQNQLATIIETRKLKRYPNEAIQNNWEGTSTVTLMIGADGKIAGVETSTSSGHDMLDEQARISLSKGKPFVQIPEGLKGKRFEARVRVVFSLKH